MYIIGRKPILEAIQSGRAIEKIWLDRSIRGEFEVEIRNLTRDHKIPFSKVLPEKLNHLAKSKNHQGVVALTALLEYESIEDLIPYFYEQGKSPRFMLLDGIEDVRNFAAISRSASWFGFDAIIVGMKNAAPVNSIAIKVSAGALLNIPVCREKSLTNTIEYLKETGFKIYGADMEGEALKDKEQRDNICLVIGSEENGINPRIKSMCDKIYSIPGSGEMESLNVSVASGIFMYEFCRD